jgi:hypothetical protein
MSAPVNEGPVDESARQMPIENERHKMGKKL